MMSRPALRAAAFMAQHYGAVGQFKAGPSDEMADAVRGTAEGRGQQHIVPGVELRVVRDELPQAPEDDRGLGRVATEVTDQELGPRFEGVAVPSLADGLLAAVPEQERCERPEHEYVVVEADGHRVRDHLDVVAERFEPCRGGQHVLGHDAVEQRTVGPVGDDTDAQTAIDRIGHVSDGLQSGSGQMPLGGIHERRRVPNGPAQHTFGGQVDREDLRQRLHGDAVA